MNILILLILQPCLMIQLLDGLMIVEYQFVDYNNIQFTLTCKTQFWCLIGFGSTYSNADIIRMSNVNGLLKIEDTLEQNKISFTSPNVDSQQDIYILDGLINDTYLYSSFLKSTNSDDPTDELIDPYSNVEMFYAINEKNIDFETYTQYGRFQLQTYQCHYTCATCNGPFAYQCTMCNEKSIQVLNGYCNTNNYNNVTKLLNKQILIKDEFNLEWEYDKNDNIILQIEISLCDWFGLGFNNDKMENTDMLLIKIETVIINNEKGYYVQIDDMFGTKNTAPLSDTQLYGTQDWILDGFVYYNSTELFVIRVHRKLLTSDKYDFDFSQKKDTLCIYAFGRNGQQYHSANRGAFQFELSKNKQSYQEDYWDKLVLNGHVILMLLFWSFISDIGIFYGRQLKSYPKYVRVHGMIFLFLSIVTYFFVFGMISQQQKRIQQLGYQDTKIILHFILGVVILLIMTTQIFLGLLARNNLESNNGTYLIYKVKYIHKYFGYLLYIITKVQVIIGISIYDSAYIGLFIIYYVLLFLIKFTIEMLYYYQVSAISRKRIKYSQIEQDQQTLYESIIEKLNTGTPYQEMIEDYPKITYIILREAVYDVSDFNHPGGQYIFRKIKGREVGRYFYGSYPIKDTQLHKHSLFAINYIETRYLGDFKNESCPILYTVTDFKKPSHVWTLQEIKSMGTNVSLFKFINQDFKVNQTIQGVQWFGRYFYIKPYGIGIDFQERPYTVVSCLSEMNIKYRYELIEYFKQKDWTKPLPQQPQLSNVLQFVIKKYNGQKNLSKFIHTASHKRFEITGPYGFGLELDDHSSGVHYVFCQGTGVLPFLDLCDYLLRKAIFSIMYQDGLPIQQQYNQLDKFKLILNVSSKTQILGYPILQDLEYLNNQFNLNLFEFNIIKQHYTKRDLQDRLKYQAAKVYVCGFQQFEDDLIELLQQCGVDSRNIVQI
ncbi:unnamed protein product [Paramecium primaurelia]|uniref:DOMON domain-containing protein n=1 Tax=Paramecium primaurelia TaxID=5886 RepID=A0A8S1LTU6_PARPR|nr:unnamed protein product [Paramecium primaurelia]